MSEKTLRIVVIGALVLVAAWAASTFLGGGGSGAAGADSPLARALVRAAEPGVEAVDLRRDVDTLRLVRDEEGWSIDGHATDSAQVARFWTAVDSARVTEIAARNPAHHDALGITDAAALTLVFHRGDGDSVRLLLGKAGPYYPSVYARLPGQDDVWLVRGSLRREASRSADEWRDRTVARVDTSVLRTVVVTRHDTTLRLVRGDTAWSVDGKPADGGAVGRMLDQLADLQASAFAPDSVRPGHAVRTVTALGAGGDTLAVVRFAERPGEGYWATVPGRAVAFEVPRFRVDRIAPAVTVLRPAPGTTRPPSALRPAGAGPGVAAPGSSGGGGPG
ncbi:MAG TPA: DUF4340 domain-containing protein [Gemmatimonadota bacterium]|nr:DUF4340 domain-containing protein [Gemmatimonadota bacterium]